MEIDELTDESLQASHQLIIEALQTDDATAKEDKPYSVREHRDWKKQADKFEAVMKGRKLQFEPIDWSAPK
jgi:hypothetical protein